ncbi:MAG: hypothetical protein ACPLY9_06205 [Nitrososphaerales archaeon]
MRIIIKNLVVLLLLVCIVSSAMIPVASAVDELLPSDFEQESWEKTIDYLDYVREYALSHGETPPPEDWHAYLYLTYVNMSGLQMMYAGLSNITVTTEWQDALTIPIQTWMMHYKSQNGSKDVVTAGSFIMLMAFSEGSDTIFDDSPDMNDTLYSSFNLGVNLASHFEGSTPPALSTKTTIIPLTSSQDKLNWHWGMKYTNLTAIWWRTYINPSNPHTELLPIAITRYDELTFTYYLTFNPSEGTSTLTANYIIGKITDLWIFPGIFGWIFPGPLVAHYNSTGCYRLNGQKESDETVYQFLNKESIKMSIVQFQSTVVLNHSAEFESEGTNVNDNEVDVSDSRIITTAEDGDRIFEANFGTKKNYKLYNFTVDPTESTYETYNANTRTSKIAGFAHQPMNGIFRVHTYLMRYIPWVIANIDPELFEQAKGHLLDWNYADYFYIISYPIYRGYRVEHDPTYTAYLTIPSASIPKLSAGLFILILIVIIAVAIASVLLIRKRKTRITPPMIP